MVEIHETRNWIKVGDHVGHLQRGDILKFTNKEPLNFKYLTKITYGEDYTTVNHKTLTAAVSYLECCVTTVLTSTSGAFKNATKLSLEIEIKGEV